MSNEGGQAFPRLPILEAFRQPLEPFVLPGTRCQNAVLFDPGFDSQPHDDRNASEQLLHGFEADKTAKHHVANGFETHAVLFDRFLDFWAKRVDLRSCHAGRNPGQNIQITRPFIGLDGVNDG